MKLTLNLTVNRQLENNNPIKKTSLVEATELAATGAIAVLGAADTGTEILETEAFAITTGMEALIPHTIMVAGIITLHPTIIQHPTTTIQILTTIPTLTIHHPTMTPHLTTISI